MTLDLIDAEENKTEYGNLPQRVQNKLTEQEVRVLKELQKSFLESSRYVNRVLDDGDFDDSLRYIVHDWYGDHDGQGFRNDELMSWLTKISDAKKRIEEEENEN